MNTNNLTKIFLVTSQVITLSTLVLSRSGNTQTLIPPLDLNQSRQFFQEGKDRFEGEVERFADGQEVVKIKLPKDYDKPQSPVNSDSIKQENESKPTFQEESTKF